MAVYGLQTEFMNKVLSEYFGLETPSSVQKEIYIGLGLTQLGADVNMETFNEVFGGKPLGNYQRARVIFGQAVNGKIQNLNEIAFNIASEDWTDGTYSIEMLGIFDSIEANATPLIVIPLSKSISVIKGETVMLAKNSISLQLTDI